MKDLQEFIPIQDHKIKPVHIYLIKIVYLCEDDTEIEGDMGEYYSDRKSAEEAMEFYKSSSALPPSVKYIEYSIEEKRLLIKI